MSFEPRLELLSAFSGFTFKTYRHSGFTSAGRCLYARV